MSIRIGEVLDPNYVAIRLYANKRVVCGSPQYFAEHGFPQTLEELPQHNCLSFNLQGGQHRGWTFLRDGKQVAIKVAGNLYCNDGELLYDWAKRGLGLCWRSTWEIQNEVESGALVTVLDEFALPSYDIQGVYPQQHYLPAKVRFFIAFLKEVYNRPGYWKQG
jgi:DNA-binding transcriptional LysR family regulator